MLNISWSSRVLHIAQDAGPCVSDVTATTGPMVSLPAAPASPAPLECRRALSNPGLSCWARSSLPSPLLPPFTLPSLLLPGAERLLFSVPFSPSTSKVSRQGCPPLSIRSLALSLKSFPTNPSLHRISRTQACLHASVLAEQRKRRSLSRCPAMKARRRRSKSRLTPSTYLAASF